MSRDCVIKIVKLDPSDTKCQQSSRETESRKQLTGSVQNATEQGTSQTVKEMTTDDGTGDADSETSSNCYMVEVDVDECDDSASDFEIDIDDDLQDTTGKTREPDSREDASEKLLPSSVGASALKNDIQSSYASSQFQPSIKLKRIDPAEIRRLTAVKSSVPDDGHKAKSRYVICTALSIPSNHYITLNLKCKMPKYLSHFTETLNLQSWKGRQE